MIHFCCQLIRKSVWNHKTSKRNLKIRPESVFHKSVSSPGWYKSRHTSPVKSQVQMNKSHINNIQVPIKISHRGPNHRQAIIYKSHWCWWCGLCCFGGGGWTWAEKQHFPLCLSARVQGWAPPNRQRTLYIIYIYILCNNANIHSPEVQQKGGGKQLLNEQNLHTCHLFMLELEFTSKTEENVNKVTQGQLYGSGFNISKVQMKTACKICCGLVPRRETRQIFTCTGASQQQVKLAR